MEDSNGIYLIGSLTQTTKMLKLQSQQAWTSAQEQRKRIRRSFRWSQLVCGSAKIIEGLFSKKKMEGPALLHLDDGDALVRWCVRLPGLTYQLGIESVGQQHLDWTTDRVHTVSWTGTKALFPQLLSKLFSLKMERENIMWNAYYFLKGQEGLKCVLLGVPCLQELTLNPIASNILIPVKKTKISLL